MVTWNVMKAKEMFIIVSVFIVERLHCVKLSSNDTHIGGVAPLEKTITCLLSETQFKFDVKKTCIWFSQMSVGVCRKWSHVRIFSCRHCCSLALKGDPPQLRQPLSSTFPSPSPVGRFNLKSYAANCFCTGAFLRVAAKKCHRKQIKLTTTTFE